MCIAVALTMVVTGIVGFLVPRNDAPLLMVSLSVGLLAALAYWLVAPLAVGELIGKRIFSLRTVTNSEEQSSRPRVGAGVLRGLVTRPLALARQRMVRAL